MSESIQNVHFENVINNHTQDMTNKTVAITGTTSGTGYVLAREVAKKGATVLLLNRESERSRQSLQNLKQEVPDGKFDSIACDLQNFESVKNAANIIKNKYDMIDALVNNAGVMAMKDQATMDGYDIQMQTNVLSHFLLTKELYPLIRNSEQGRIVNHTSMARLGGPLEAEYFEKKGGDLGGDGIEEDNMNFRGPRWKRYRQTKLANCAFTYGLKERLEAKGINNVLPLLAHPGLAATNLQVTTAKDGGMEKDAELMNMAQSAEDGATGIIRATMDKDVKSGDFFGPSGQGWQGFPELLTPEEILYDPSTISINWKGCENAVGKFVID